MSKQYKPIFDRQVIFSENFNDEQSTRKNGGVPTDVTFSQGKGTFDGSGSSIFYYGKSVEGTFSVRIRCNPTSFAANRVLFDNRGDDASGAGIIYTNITTGDVTTIGGGISYVNGEVGVTVTAGEYNEIIVTGIGLQRGSNDRISVGVNYADVGQLLGDIDLIEIYQGTLTAEEVSNLYHGNRYIKPSVNQDRGVGTKFNGSNQYAYVADNGALDINQATTDFCFGGYIKTGSDITTAQAVLGKAALQGVAGKYSIYINAGAMRVELKSTSSPIDIADNITLAVNTEYHVCVRVDLSGGKAYYYIDNVLQNAGGTSLTTDFPTMADSEKFSIGATDSPSNHFGGQLRDIRIYHTNVVADIPDIMNGELLGTEIAHFPCDDRNLTTVRDTIETYDLTAANFSYYSIDRKQEIAHISASRGVIEERWDNTLTITNSSVFKEGQIRVIQCNGTSSVVETTLADDLNTLSIWIKPKTADESIIDLGGGNTVTIASGVLTAAWADDLYVNGVAGTAIQHGQWQLISCRVDTAITLTDIDIGKISTAFYDGFWNDLSLVNGIVTDAELNQQWTSTKMLYSK